MSNRIRRLPASASSTACQSVAVMHQWSAEFAPAEGTLLEETALRTFEGVEFQPGMSHFFASASGSMSSGQRRHLAASARGGRCAVHLLVLCREDRL